MKADMRRKGDKRPRRRPGNTRYKKTNKNDYGKSSREIYLVGGFFVLVLVILSGYFINFINNDSENYIYSSYNARYETYAKNIVRGDIVTADGKVIASTSMEDTTEKRVYPYKEAFSHAVGYVDEGKSGLEAQYSFDLLKTHSSVNKQINSNSDKKIKGDALVTTLDFDTQMAAYEGMGDYNGAVIAIEPSTGKIIAMVSKPDFDPNIIDTYWDLITDETNDSSILLNRAIQGQYPPGSTFKIISTIAYLRENGGNAEGFSYNCKGNISFEDISIHCSSNKKHGTVDLKDAFSESCNCAFASLGQEVSTERFNSVTNDLLFNATLPTALNGTKESKFKLDNSSSASLIGQTSMGQGNTVVTPIHMCMIASAIANGGDLYEPYMVDHIQSTDNFVVNAYSPHKYGQIITSDECKILKEYMRSVVLDGTADDVDFGNLQVYGKTGTAEYSTNKKEAHSWFVGYAENSEGKKLAIAVIMEGAGYGSKYAAPLAAKVFNSYLE